MRRPILILFILALSAVIFTQPDIAHAGPPTGQSHRVFLPFVLASDDGGQGRSNALSTFAASISNGEAQTLRGVYSQDRLAISVVQQPFRNYAFVSSSAETATQFGLAQAAVTGLLAHNFLAGKLFFDLQPGDTIFLVFGDGRSERYSVTTVQRYQALDPNNPSSDLLDLDSNQSMTAAQVFARHYLGGRRVTLQTCITQDGISSWGRLFITAVP